MNYRGHDYEGECEIHVGRRRRGSIAKSVWRWMRRRAAIEPSIGHLKEERRMVRCRLKGTEGDKVNAILSAAAMNFSKLLAALGASLSFLLARLVARFAPHSPRRTPRRLPGRLFQDRLIQTNRQNPVDAVRGGPKAPFRPGETLPGARGERLKRGNLATSLVSAARLQMLSGHSPDFRLTRGLAGESGPEHEDSDCEGSQRREQADRGAPGEPKHDESEQGCNSADERVGYLGRGVVNELYARPDGGQDRRVGQRGCVVPENGTRQYGAERGDQEREIDRDHDLGGYR